MFFYEQPVYPVKSFSDNVVSVDYKKMLCSMVTAYSCQKRISFFNKYINIYRIASKSLARFLRARGKRWGNAPTRFGNFRDII